MDDPIGSQLLIQLVLILVNAFFASTETAVVSLNENRIRKQAEDGDNAAVVMLKMIESPTRFLSTIQVCITLSGFLASAFAADNFASKLADAIIAAGFTLLSPALLNTICVVLITLVLSYFMIVLGELVPKRIALHNAERVARFTCSIINTVAAIFSPLVWLLTVSTNGVLRLLRINPDENTEEVTEEEIRMMVDIGSESGAIEQDERTMITGFVKASIFMATHYEVTIRCEENWGQNNRSAACFVDFGDSTVFLTGDIHSGWACELPYDTGAYPVAGGSAGGHLACSLGVFWSSPMLYEPLNCDPEAIRPDGMILSYPVITGGEYAHKDSMRRLFGTEDPTVWEPYSLEKHIHAGVPATFVWHTYEDELVPVENTLMLAAALRKHHVPLEMHIFPHGPHGLSLNTPEVYGPGVSFPMQNVETRCWLDLAKRWIEQL